MFEVSDLFYDLNLAYAYSVIKRYGDDEAGYFYDLFDELYIDLPRRYRRRFRRGKKAENQLKAFTIKNNHL